MTDKQIIIDNVDVKKCVYHESGYCSINKQAYCYCCDNPNCHFKQLKRKEQECEELKEQLIQCDDNIIVDCEYSKKDLCSFIHRKKEVINGLEQQIDQLKAENDELKNKIKELLHDCNSCNFHKYKQTLTEIKEIAEKGHKEKGNLMRTWWFKDIIQKISEVEDG